MAGQFVCQADVPLVFADIPLARGAESMNEGAVTEQGQVEAGAIP
jgi:hypothetical protein